MIVRVENRCDDYRSYRAARVKSLQRGAEPGVAGVEQAGEGTVGLVGPLGAFELCLRDGVQERIPDVDLIIAAHSHDVVSRRARHATRLGGIGYHPSLLPLHRGRDAVRWTIRDRDRVAGGSVYWLDDRVDAGPIAAQDYLLVPTDATPSSLWRDHLFPLGIRLLAHVLADLDAGRVVRVPQDDALATWEPAMDAPPLARPDLPELPAPNRPRQQWVVA